MKQFAATVWHFYLDGFRSMTTGRVLWLIILLKLFIIFFILRLFFFPDFLNSSAAGNEKDDYVSGELIQRAIDN